MVLFVSQEFRFDLSMVVFGDQYILCFIGIVLHVFDLYIFFKFSNNWYLSKGDMHNKFLGNILLCGL